MKLTRISIHNQQKVFFGSDFHLSHLRDFIWKPRGFNSFEEHTKAVLAGVNAKVGDNDVLFFLGDFSLNSNPEQTKTYLRAIKCKNIFFIWGNHESSTQKIYREELKQQFPGLSPLQEVYPLRWENVTFLGQQVNIELNKQVILLSHFAHLTWEDMQHGTWNLCGHSHGNCPPINPLTDEGKILDVGVDNALRLTGTPVLSLEEVAEVMNTKKIKVIDHHNEKTT